MEEIYGFSGDDASALLRGLDEMRGTRFRQGTPVRRMPNGDRIDTYLGKATTDITAFTSTTTVLTTLDGAINNSVTSIVVHSVGSMPTGVQFIITIGTEDILVISISSLTLTVARGANGTTAASHADAANVSQTIDALGTGTADLCPVTLNDDGDYAVDRTQSFSETVLNVSALIAEGDLFLVQREPFSGQFIAATQFGSGGGSSVPDWSTTVSGILNTTTQIGAGLKATTGSWQAGAITGQVTRLDTDKIVADANIASPLVNYAKMFYNGWTIKCPSSATTMDTVAFSVTSNAFLLQGSGTSPTLVFGISARNDDCTFIVYGADWDDTAPAWNNATTYAINDRANVMNVGVGKLFQYRAIVSNTNSQPPNANWVLIGGQPCYAIAHGGTEELGFTGTLAAAIAAGKNVVGGIIVS